jgi:hypothetical protein
MLQVLIQLDNILPKGSWIGVISSAILRTEALFDDIFIQLNPNANADQSAATTDPAILF